MFYKYLFPVRPDQTSESLFLLAMRIIFGLLLMNHGIQKWSHFHELSTTFADPLGVGSTVSVSLAIFAELFCSMAFIVGFLFRLALIPMTFTMAMAFFVIHSGDPFFDKELPFVYMILYIMLFISGPGKYSVDYLLRKTWDRSRQPA
ncbi:MAG: DoxX family protein [Bacteroides sp.]|nr:DoxX family protein [Bacteroides sp.]